MLIDQPTGISNYCLNLLPYLLKFQPHLLTAKVFEGFNCYPIPNNLTPAQGSKGHLRRLLWTQLALPKIYQKLKGSFLFSPVPEAPLYSSCNYITIVHDLIPLRFPRAFSPLTYYFRYYIPQVLYSAVHIVCNSKATATDLIDFYGIKQKKITIIPLAYAQNHFRPLNLTRKPYFLHLGRHDLHKNIGRIIEAFAKIPDYQNYELWLVGPTDQRYTPRLKAQVLELGLQEKVKFLDYLPNDVLPEVINQAIALVFPSLWEGFGFPVLEAMGCGTPVITANLSSLPEVAGEAAILVNPYSVLEISQAMKDLASDSQLHSDLSILGLKQAEKFTWEKTGKATAEVLGKYC
jgi:glycosyltransferase involved in cell wall biosynthesis